MGKTELGGGDSLGESSNSVTRGLLRDLVLVLVALLQALVFFMMNQNAIERNDMRAKISQQSAEIAGLQEKIAAARDRLSRIEYQRERQ